MRNVKMLVALLLSLVMIISLAACSSIEKKDDDKDEEKTEQVDDNKDKDDDEETEEDNKSNEDEEDDKSNDDDDKSNEDEEDEKKPSKNDDPEDLIVGEWAAKVDITDSVIEGFALGLGDEEAAEYFDFDKMYLNVFIEFKKNGDIKLGVDGEDFVDIFVEGIEAGIEDYADANGIDMEDVYANLETDEDNFAEDFAAMLGFDSLSGEMEAEYEIDGDEIVIDGEGCEFEFDGEDTLLLDTVGLGLETLTEDDVVEFERL